MEKSANLRLTGLGSRSMAKLQEILKAVLSMVMVVVGVFAVYALIQYVFQFIPLTAP